MDPNILLWIGQVFLALAMAAVGYGHGLGFDAWSGRPGQAWMAVIGRSRMGVIAALEILAVAGLILPAASGVLPWLTPLAAAGVAILMIAAAIFHAQRPDERPNLILNLFLAAIAILIVYGRVIVSPL